MGRGSPPPTPAFWVTHPAMEREQLLAEVNALIKNDEAAAKTLVRFLTERDGGLGLMLTMLSRRPEVFVPHVLQGMHLYAEPKAIDPKTAELAAVAASAALMCDYCLDAHMRAALSKGATLDEIFDVLLVAGAIAESSTLAVAFRRYRVLERTDSKPGEA